MENPSRQVSAQPEPHRFGMADAAEIYLLQLGQARGLAGMWEHAAKVCDAYVAAGARSDEATGILESAAEMYRSHAALLREIVR